ncbi:50S ribosomal protein L6 [Candidatus Gracilibacteria bacterium]|nr:50S ribosomal protein L6 [Candidatus Gracilibacteria bacterium]
MSKIGKKPIIIPDGVEVTIEKNLIKVKGPKGELSYNFLDCVNLKKEEKELIVEVLDDEKRNIWGLTRTLISNMVEGVTNGYEKKLLVTGVGYLAKLEGNKLVLSLGLSHKVNFEVPKDIEVAVDQDPKGNSIITMKSIDKQNLGEVAANIRFLRPPEPYKGKGIRYFDEVIKLKAGKSAKK